MREAPCKLLMGRKLRTRLDKILPSSARKHVWSHQESKLTTLGRQFSVGNSVSVRKYIGSDKWIVGTVIKTLGIRYYHE